ncbi:MAG: AzlC family ABC transporter permease [Firmicutes bacterium]|nr:AzlC family ABC transporter permease [Bacillota bacterium]
MRNDSLKKEISEGLRDGLPIGMGYFAVAFSLGITAKLAGLTPLQGFVSSFLNHASAGEYALYTMIASKAAYAETAVLIAVTNIRYLLMGAAFSQKLRPEEPLLSRLAIGFGITDEIFGIGIARKGFVNTAYLLSAFMLASLMWSAGTACGIAMGSVLPACAVSALSVAIYGMFLAIIIPPSKKDRVVGALVAISFILSFAAAKLPMFANVSGGTKTIVLTVIISAAAAAMFPKSDEEGGEA